MEGKRIGAMIILTTIVLPWLVYGSIKVFKNEKDIAVLRKEEAHIIKTLDRIENKVDTLNGYLIKGE